KWTPYDRTQQLVKALDELVPDGSDRQTQAMLLRMVGVKHLIVHHIGVPTAGIRLTQNSDRGYLERALRASGLATPEGAFDDRSIWRFDGAVQRAYAPDCIFGVPPRADVYDVLALAPAASACRAPAAIATQLRRARSEEVLTPETFRSDSARGVAIGVPASNVDIESVGAGRGFYATVPPRAQDVEILPLTRVPRNATGVSFRMRSSAPRRVYVQLYSPDERNFFQASVDFSGPVQDVALNFRDFGAVGKPDIRRLRFIRFASTNAGTRDLTMYVGALHWLDRQQATRIPPYLVVTGNRWDKFYFGGDREHVLFEPTEPRTRVYATLVLDRDGLYDVVAHLQDDHRDASLRAWVDGRASGCTPSGGNIDQTERLVRLLRLPLRAGTHTLALQYCNAPKPAAPASADVGVQSVVVAAAHFEPPAFRAGGSLTVVEAAPGTLRLHPNGNYLVFTDSFDDRWTAGQDGLTLQHVLANGYANAWRIPDAGAGDVVLQFWPQRSFEFGIAVSLGLAAVCIVMIVLTLYEPRRAAQTRGLAVEQPVRR
ncbi:MAG: hypothetical protein JOZ01_09405, partial [Candidatus Eremiobacteraeota bacterium]|nr:hypothetical protein [Candidatus Eremiobacteraeota bacterium]